MNRADAVALALAVAAIALIVAARSPPASIGCVEELVAASTCLPPRGGAARGSPSTAGALRRMLQGRPRSGPRRRGRPRLLLPPDPPPRPLRLPSERVPNRRAILLLQRFRAPRRRRFLYGILPRSEEPFPSSRVTHFLHVLD